MFDDEKKLKLKKKRNSCKYKWYVCIDDHNHMYDGIH